jgi:hypothetical protein
MVIILLYFLQCSSQHFPACPGIASGMVRTNWYLSPDRRRALILLIRSSTAPSKSATQACLKAEHVDLPKSRNRHNDDDSGARRTAPKMPQPLRGVYCARISGTCYVQARNFSLRRLSAELELINSCQSGESVCCTEGVWCVLVSMAVGPHAVGPASRHR